MFPDVEGCQGGVLFRRRPVMTNRQQEVRHPSHAMGPVQAIRVAAALKRWHVPALVGEDSALPYITLEGDEPVLLAFATRGRAFNAVRGWIQSSADAHVSVASVDPLTAEQVFRRLHQRGIQWIRIDHGPRSIRLPLEPLIGAMQQVRERGSDMGPAAALLDWIGQQDCILVLRDDAVEDFPLVEIIDELPSIRLFCDRRRALARATQVDHSGRPARASLMSLDGESSVTCLRQLAQLGVEQVLLEQAGGVRRVPLHRFLEQERRAA